jgi:DNA modification methylase
MNVLNQKTGKNWIYYHGDCCEVIKGLPDDKIHYSIFSPPFCQLYVYSNSERDMGNTKDDAQFMEHFRFLVNELFRVTMPGRLCSFHCMNLPQSKTTHGEIGIRDFRGELIRMFVAAGWIYHSEVVIWKDPVVAMQRTKALGLLHKQIKKDSCMSRQGIPDYLVTMRKPGNNPERVDGEFQKYAGDEKAMNNRNGAHTEPDTKTRFSIDIWQRYASPVWMDINPSLTLQRKSARDEKDERHVCPLQLQVIERGVDMWSNPGDTVLSPFGGIASEGYQSLRMGRKFIGIELKESYWKQGCLNLAAAESSQNDLLKPIEIAEPEEIEVETETE